MVSHAQLNQPKSPKLMMAAPLTYFRTYVQALQTIQTVARQTLEVARAINRAGDVVLRDLTAEDLGLQHFRLTIPAGNTNPVDFVGTAVNPAVVPDRKAFGFYGLVLEVEDPAVHVDYVDLYVGGSRLRRWALHAVKDSADAGRTLYFSADNAVVLKEGTKFHIQVKAVNTDTANPRDIVLSILGFVGEPLGDTIMRKTPISLEA